MSLIIILSTLINFSKKINELSRNLFQDKLDSIFVSVPNKETEFYNQFNNKYFSSSEENFNSLIKLNRLTSEEKIVWLYSEGNFKEKHKSNLKALYHFIGELFCTEDKMFIENVIVEYFQNKNGALYSKDKFSNTHSKWINNKNPNHLSDMSESIKSLMKYR
ncbi:hypothetical protein [Algibacter pectinivorans]|nr:hypothetical protein [Algibacter pectinivorans]